MDDLVQWLGEQLDMDERVARAATPGPWSVNDESFAETIYGAKDVTVVAGGRWGGEAPVFESDEDAIHIAEHDPARVLREVDAKRQLLDEHRPDGTDCSICADPEDFDDDADGHREWFRHGKPFPCRTLRLIASVYADRNGYREEWRP